MTTRIPVASAQPYEVVVGHGAVTEVRGLVAGAARVVVVHPPVLAGRARALRDFVARDGLDVHLVEVPDGEAAKTSDVAAFCWGVLADAGFTRSDVVVGLGGGATTDLAGFVAATWLRGVGFVTVPTTVLGMVDAAVGGKTGINLPAGKNLVGSFHEPLGVLCDLDSLHDLPAAEVRSGLAEVVKCGFIADPVILELVERDPAAASSVDGPVLAELVARGIAVKARTVAGDLRETGAGGGIGREALNYGHTLGHAIERAEHFGVRHGEGVAVGMVFAAELAHRAGRIDADLLRRHRTVLDAVGLPTSYRGHASYDALLAGMRLDKKTRGTELRFVVLDGVGRTSILAGPSDADLRAAHAAVTR